MPIATRSFVLFACLASNALAQAVPTDGAQWLAALGDPERSLDAVRQLTACGAPAVELLLAAMRDPGFHADADKLADAVFALGKLGDVAAPAAQQLLDELPDAPDRVRRNLYWALGEIGPKADGGKGVLLARLTKLKPLPGWDHQEWSIACRRIEVGLAPQTAELEDLLQQEDHATLIAAAELLCRQPAVPVSRERLLAAWQYVFDGMQQYGEGWHRVAQELARAVVLRLPGSDAAAEARLVLVYHFDVAVRLEAAMQLGQSPGPDKAVAVDALRSALGDESLLVRREAVTSLGMLGTAAQKAVPVLSLLEAAEDVQVRARAKAALRAIAKAGK